MTYTIHHRIVRYRYQGGYGIHSVVFKGTEIVAWNYDPVTAKCTYERGPPGILDVLDHVAHAVSCPIVEELDWDQYKIPEEYVREATR